MKAQTIKKQNHRCQSKHIHPHNKTIENFWCKKCKAYVQVTTEHKCMCCGYKVSFKDKKSTVQEQRVLNQFVTKYQELINWYSENNYRFDKDAPIILQLKVGYWIYQIDMRWIIKYVEVANIDSWNDWENATERIPPRIKNYNKMLATIQMIKPHLHKVDFEISWGRSKVTLAD